MQQRLVEENAPLGGRRQIVLAKDPPNARQPSGMSAVLPHLEITPQRPHWLAGAPGFEPGNGGIKIRSTSSRLTSSRRQIVGLHGGGPVRGLLLTDERARRARAVSNQFWANMTRKICRTKCRINLKISTARIS